MAAGAALAAFGLSLQQGAAIRRGVSRQSFVPAWALAMILALGVAVASTTASANDKHAALIVDGNDGAVLHAEQADELRYPASLTKMMTLYLAFEAIERGRMSYATRLKVSQEAASAPPTRLDLDPGETIALIDAMKGLITKSANDAAIVVAEHLGGTEANFARMMTAKARLFGMSRTTFRNASGLPDPGQVTTARDMIRLALRLQDDFPQHYHLFQTRSFSYDGSHYRNHNNLLYRFQGTDGIKTGYTRSSGFNLVSSVRRGGRHVVGVIFGGRTAGRRDDAMQLMLSRALMKSSPYKSRKPAPVLVAVAEPARKPVYAAAAASTLAPKLPPVPGPNPGSAPVAAAPAIEQPAPRPRPVMVPQRPRAEAVVADAGMPWRQSAAPVLAVPAPAPAIRPQAASANAAPVNGASNSLTGTQNQGAAYQGPGSQYPAAPATPAASSETNQRLAFAPRGFDVGAASPTPSRGPASPPPVATDAPGIVRGAGPSTFQQQAASLSRSPEPRTIERRMPEPRHERRAVEPPAPQRALPAASAVRGQLPAPYAVRGPLPAPTQATAGGGIASGFEIQIGAFGTAGEADRALSTARGAAGDLLRGSEARAVAVRKDSRQIYRARFVGFDSRTAASTCLELRRRQIDCFVMRAE